ncbi:MAG: carboxypeptidase regulatory-like domain-containing protein [Thioalkalivibrio sp.]|nr:carboxypeptidase regulatory-like domain-containing protein [Thioalkalivibrio sp.]
MQSFSMPLRTRVAFAISAALVLTGCDPGRALEAEPQTEHRFEISGKVLDSATGDGIAGALIVIQGVASGTTAADGTYRFGDARNLMGNAPPLLRVEAPGYAPMVVKLRRADNVALLPAVHLTSLTVPVATGPEGGAASFRNGVRIHLPPGAVQVATSLRTALSPRLPLSGRALPPNALLHAALFIGPESMRFSKNVRVEVPLAVPGTRGKELRVYRFQAETDEWVDAGAAMLGADGETAEMNLSNTGYFIIVQADGTRIVGTITDTTLWDDWGSWSQCIEGPAEIVVPGFVYSPQYTQSYTDNRLQSLMDTFRDQYSPDVYIAETKLGFLGQGEALRFRIRSVWVSWAEVATVEFSDGSVGSYQYSHVEFLRWELDDPKNCDPQGLIA